MNLTSAFTKCRVDAGFSIRDVSGEFGVAQREVEEWERGKTLPPPYVIRALETIARFESDESTARVEPMTVDLENNRKMSGTPTRMQPPTHVEKAKLTQAVPAKDLIKSKKRVADHGEVFTPDWLVEKMLDLVKGETERIDSRFLEPACGSGNFLVPILQRKLAAVELKYGKSDFEKRHHALQALTCCYGIELLADNIAECRANMLGVFSNYLKLDESDDLYRAAFHVLSLNLIHGDAMTMKGADGAPIMVVEWGYLGKGKFQRRDFRLDVLTGMASFREEQTLFAHLGKHEIFSPVESHPPMTVRELAALEEEHVL